MLGLSVSLHVKTEMITPGKSSITEVTLERFHSCVFSVMSRQFVRSSKLPVTTLPAAQVGLLTGVRPLVSLEMTALGVDLQREAMIRVSDAMMLATLLTKIYMDMRLKNIK